MATRRPRIKVRPNLNRARAANDSSASGEKPPNSDATDCGVKLEKDDVSSASLENDQTKCSPSATGNDPPAKLQAVVEATDEAEATSATKAATVEECMEKSEASTLSEEDSVDGTTTGKTIARRPRIKVQPNIGSRRAGGIRNPTRSASDGSNVKGSKETSSSTSLVGAEAPPVSRKDPGATETTPQETNCPSSTPPAAGQQGSSAVIRPDMVSKGDADPTEFTAVSGKVDPSTDTVDCSHSREIQETDTVEEVMKSPTRRGRLFKAKPNIMEAERRHQRLSSLSESDDPGTPWKPAAFSSEKGNAAVKSGSMLKSPNNHLTTETAANAELQEKKKQSRGKRRQSVKLEKLVSENRRSFTISDLIHMNPVSNPMKRYLNKETKKKLSEQEDKEQPASSVTSCVSSPAPATEEPSEPVEAIEVPDDNNDDDDTTKNTDALPVPQVMLGPDGNIVLNDASLSIKNIATEPDPAIVESEVVVHNDNYDPSFYYKSRKRSVTWTIKETTKFYVALSCLGTDFSLMEKLFPKRDRAELKRKFKLEEKKHRALVDKALGERLTLDMSLFDTSDDDGDKNDDEKGPVGEQENIADTVKELLTTEKKESNAKRRSNARAQDEKKKREKANHSQNTRTPVRKTKKKKYVWRSRYYDCSDNESEDQDVQEDVKNDEGSGAEDGSSDESMTLQRMVETTTRSGRQPKRAVPFTIPEEKVRKRRHCPPPRSSPALANMQIDTRLAPLICSPPRGISHEVLEDTGTGQRLLLVRSPPPCAKDGSREFVHVYLMSPKPTQNGMNDLSPVVHQNDETDVFIPPPAAASKWPTPLQEEIITDDSNCVYEECSLGVSNNRQNPDSNEQKSLQNMERCEFLQNVKIHDYTTKTDEEVGLNADGNGRGNMDVYESAEITTLTNDEGHVIEILIDPGLSDTGQPVVEQATDVKLQMLHSAS